MPDIPLFDPDLPFDDVLGGGRKKFFQNGCYYDSHGKYVERDFSLIGDVEVRRFKSNFERDRETQAAKKKPSSSVIDFLRDSQASDDPAIENRRALLAERYAE